MIFRTIWKKKRAWDGMVIYRAFALVLLFFVGCGGGGHPSSPLGVVKAYLEAYKDSDYDEMADFVTDTEAEKIQAYEDILDQVSDQMGDAVLDQMEQMLSALQYNVQDEQINGDKATVNVTLTWSGNSMEQGFGLIKEEGMWKIESGLSLGGGGGG